MQMTRISARTMPQLPAQVSIAMALVLAATAAEHLPMPLHLHPTRMVVRLLHVEIGHLRLKI